MNARKKRVLKNQESKKYIEAYEASQNSSSSMRLSMTDDPMRQQVILDYLPLIRYIGQKLSSKLPANVDLDDLCSAGVIGLMDAIDKYSPERENKFKTYAEFRIRGAMLDELRLQDWIPRSVREYKKKEDKVRALLEVELGRPVSQQEVAERLEITIEQYHKRSGRSRISIVSLDEHHSQQNQPEKDKTSLLELLAFRPDLNPCKQFDDKYIEDLMSKVIETLPEKQRLVLSLYYYEDLNLKEIGRILDVTESRVSQLHTQALQTIKEKLDFFFREDDDKENYEDSEGNDL